MIAATVDWQAHGSLRPAEVRGIERAVSAQILDVRRHWRIDAVRWGAGPDAWTLSVVEGQHAIDQVCGDPSDAFPLPAGCSTLTEAGLPVIYVLDEPADHQDMSVSVSHEVVEASFLRYSSQPQICDPVEDRGYVLDGWRVSDYVFPDGRDELGALRAARARLSRLHARLPTRPIRTSL